MDYDVRLKSNGAYWQAWWYDAKGRVETRGLGSKRKVSERQARAKCRALALELAEGAHVTTNAPKLSEWIAKYSASRQHLSLGTRRCDADTARYLERFFDWDPTLDEITRALAADWRDALARGELSLDNAEKTDAPSETTVRNHVRRARSVFAEALARDLVAFNAFDRLKATPPRVEKDWAYIGLPDTKRLLEACPNEAWRALIALCRFAGLRRGEALALRWQDVDFDRNRLRLNAVIQVETTKKRRRACPIELAKFPTGLAAILHKTLAAAPDGATLVCKGVQVRNIDRAARVIIRRAGLAEYAKPFHTLRKNLKTDWTTHYPEFAVCEWLGHSMEVGREHYLAVLDTMWQPPEVPTAQAPAKPLAQAVPNRPSERRTDDAGAASESDANRPAGP